MYRRGFVRLHSRSYSLFASIPSREDVCPVLQLPDYIYDRSYKDDLYDEVLVVNLELDTELVDNGVMVSCTARAGAFGTNAYSYVHLPVPIIIPFFFLKTVAHHNTYFLTYNDFLQA